MSIITEPITLQTLFGVKRMIGPYTVQLIVNEETNDTLTITKQPVQKGASISDHAYKEPTALSMTILQQNKNTLTSLVNTFNGGGLSQIYQDFLTLQSDRIPFNVITPKRIYKNMLIAVLRMNTDKSTENILSLSLQFQEVIIVSIGATQVPPSAQANAAATQATQNAGNKSALFSLIQGLFPGTVGAQ